MNFEELRQNNLSWNNVEYSKEFDIPEDFLESEPELIDMILSSKSIESKEDKQNWLNLLPMMNEKQLSRLRQILEKEKQKLQEIEKKYERKKMDIKKKYLIKWQQMWYVKKVANIKEKEQQEQSQDDEEAEELLSKI